MLSDEQIERFPRRVFQRVGNPLEWSSIDKCLAAAVMIAPLMAVGVISAIAELNDPAVPALPAVIFARRMLHWMGLLPALWGLLGLVEWRFRSRYPESRIFLHISAQLYAVTCALVCYLYGPTTSGLIGFAVIVGALGGILLFSVYPTILSLVTFFVLMIASDVSASNGLIPYAPFAETLRLAHGERSVQWLVRSWVSIISTTVITILLFNYIFSQWRDREEKLAEAHLLLQAQKDQLVRAESLAALGSLVTGAAHELRNPLASSSALFQSLKEEIEGSPHLPEGEKREALESIEMALKGQRRAATIAERLYALSDSLASTDALGTLKTVLETVRGKYPELAVTCDGANGSLRVPERSLLTLLCSLIDNAFAAGGTEVPRLTVLDEGGKLHLIVSDTGKGIPENQQSEVFRPFFTGDKAGEGHGVGLGLYIVYELTARLGGTVTLESQEAKGTKVAMVLPCGQEPPAS